MCQLTCTTSSSWRSTDNRGFVPCQTGQRFMTASLLNVSRSLSLATPTFAWTGQTIQSSVVWLTFPAVTYSLSTLHIKRSIILGGLIEFKALLPVCDAVASACGSVITVLDRGVRSPLLTLVCCNRYSALSAAARKNLSLAPCIIRQFRSRDTGICFPVPV
jgi:hypothetical protein